MQRKLYKANPQKAVSGGELAVYSGRALQRKLYKAKPQSTVSGGQLAVYSRGGFTEETIEVEARKDMAQESAGGI